LPASAFDHGILSFPDREGVRELIERRDGRLALMLDGQSVRSRDAELEALGVRLVEEGRSAPELGDDLLPRRR
jgi:hypothetical protein